MDALAAPAVGEMAAASAVAALVPAAAPAEAEAADASVDAAADREGVAASSAVSPAIRPPTGIRPTRSRPYLHGNNCMIYVYKNNGYPTLFLLSLKKFLEDKG